MSRKSERSFLGHPSAKFFGHFPAKDFFNTQSRYHSRPGSGGQLSWISAADNSRTRTWGMQRIIILRMTCSPIQPNLWAGPDPRDDEDFRNLRRT